MPKKTTKLPAKIVKYLDQAGVDHKVLEHRTVYTAIDAANTMKKKMNEVAKSLLVKADKDYYVIIIPADYNLDFKKLAGCIGKQTGKKIKIVKIPGEKIMEEALKIKAGAMSAFGSLHKLPVFVDKGLTRVKKAVFSSGSFNHSVEMAVKDFVKVEKAIMGSFTVKKKIKKQKITKPKRSAGASKKKAAPKKKATVKKTVKNPAKKKPVKKKVKTKK
jgi:prolyl-tRNA editing enzyme YbaK/EbsC (Cys-tRNA(Pro) deacylase)